MKLQPVMLLTSNNEREYPCILKHSYMFGGPGELCWCGSNIRTPTIAQHIYLVDPNAEIKEGDLIYDKDTTRIKVAEKLHCKVAKLSDNKYYHKVICTSEPIDVIFNITLPQLSEQSIKLLIDYYNESGKMPEDVEVDSDTTQVLIKGRSWNEDWKKWPNGERPFYMADIIKLNPQGEVNITVEDPAYIRSGEIIYKVIGDDQNYFKVTTNIDLPFQGREGYFRKSKLNADIFYSTKKEYWRQGNVGIAPPKKKMYSRDEVLILTEAAFHRKDPTNSLPNDYCDDAWDEWIIKNL